MDATPRIEHRGLQFSIRQLLFFTAFVAVGCLLLLNSSELVAYSTLSAVAIVLGAATLLAVFREGQKRAYWIGFAFAGWLYLAICLGGVGGSGFSFEKVATARLATLLYWSLYGNGNTRPQNDHGLFLFTAHALWAVLFAMIAGLFAVFLYSSPSRRMGRN